MGKNITRLLLATATLATGLLLASPGFCQTAQEYLKQGNAFLGQRDYDQAIESYNKVIGMDPNLVMAYNNRGVAYIYKEQYDKAISDFNKAISLKPDDADAYDHRGNVYSRKDQYDLAIADYSKAISLKPDFAFAYYNRGNVYYSKEQYDLAIADWDKAIALEPAKYKAVLRPLIDRAEVLQKKSGTHAYTYYMQGHAYLEKGPDTLNEAIRALTKAIALDPTLALAYDDRANAFWFQGHFDLAISDASKSIALNPNNPSAYYIRGYAYYKKRTEHQKAIDDWTKVMALDPGANQYELQSLIENEKAELKSGSTANYDSEEIQYLSEEIAQNPKEPFNFYARGDAYDRKGQYERAIADWQKAIKLYPDLETELRPKIDAAKVKLKK